jgi:parallel beta-helix repeat protein
MRRIVIGVLVSIVLISAAIAIMHRPPFIVNGPFVPTASGPITISGQNGTVISGMKITSTSGPCITITNSINITIKNSEIGPCGDNNTDNSSNGILITGASGPIYVYDSYIHVSSAAANCNHTHDGIYSASTNMAGSLTIKGNILAYNQNTIFLDGLSNVTIDGNLILNTRGSTACGATANLQGHGIQFWAESGTTGGLVITNNYVLATGVGATVNGVTVDFGGAISDMISVSHTSGANISNNYVDSTGAVVQTSATGIIAEIAASGTTISDNIISNSYNCGICIASGTNQTISGNKILILMPSSNSAAGVVLEGSDNGPAPCNTISLTNNYSYVQRPDNYNQAYYTDTYCTGVTITGGHMENGCDPPSNCPAYVALYPMATTNPPPAIPPVPFTCVVRSPYSNNKSKPPCRD